MAPAGKQHRCPWQTSPSGQLAQCPPQFVWPAGQQMLALRATGPLPPGGVQLPEQHWEFFVQPLSVPLQVSALALTSPRP
jgi:hypothetical protein